MERDNYFLRAMLCCIILTGIKLLFLYNVHVNLWVDEAQYWIWSTAPDTGYYSKPPFIAWVIHLTCSIFGNSEFGIRAAAPVMHLLAAMFIYFTAKDLYNSRTAFFTSVIYLTLPGVVVSSGFISTDAPLMMFWSGAMFFLVHVTKFTDKNHGPLWVLFALCVGLGLLSKYTFAMFVLMSFYYIFSQHKDRSLFRPGFWVANVIAFLIFMPNIYWNFKNHFVSFRHTEENVVTGNISGGMKLLQMVEFILSQFAVFGPALAFFIIILFGKENDDNEQKNKKLLLLFCLPLLGTGIIISLLSGAQAHWAAPAYISATIFTVHYIIKHDRQKWLKVIITGNLIVYALCLNVKIPASIASLTKDPLARVNSWYILKDPLLVALKFHPDAKIVSDERKIIAPLEFALRDENGKPYKIYKWNPDGRLRDHFDLTQSFVPAHDELPVLFVTRGDHSKMLSDIYFNVDTILALDDNNRFYIYLVKGRRDF